MQMRFDGLLGFPGGLVDPGEHPLESANREMVEEIGLDLNILKLSDSDHVVSFVNSDKNLVLHFYGKEITLSQFQESEGSRLWIRGKNKFDHLMNRPFLETLSYIFHFF